MTQCVFISEQRLLVQMRTDRTAELYWTILDTDGKVYPLTRRLYRVLNTERWTRARAVEIYHGMTQLTLQSESTRKFALFVFDRKG